MELHYLVWLKSLASLHAIKYYINTLGLSPVWQGLSISWSSFYEGYALFDMQHAFSKRVTSCILEASANPTLSCISEASENSFFKNNSEFTTLCLEAGFDFWLWDNSLCSEFFSSDQGYLTSDVNLSSRCIESIVGRQKLFCLSSSDTSYLLEWACCLPLCLSSK